jgi:hypothetical protein
LIFAINGILQVTLDKAREQIPVRVNLDNGYRRNATRLIPGEVQCGHGQQAVCPETGHDIQLITTSFPVLFSKIFPQTGHFECRWGIKS